MAKRGDEKGYERGAKGIDGRDGEDWVRWGYKGSAEYMKVLGEDGGPRGEKSPGALMKSAKGK